MVDEAGAVTVLNWLSVEEERRCTLQNEETHAPSTCHIRTTFNAGWQLWSPRRSYALFTQARNMQCQSKLGIHAACRRVTNALTTARLHAVSHKHGIHC